MLSGIIESGLKFHMVRLQESFMGWVLGIGRIIIARCGRGDIVVLRVGWGGGGGYVWRCGASRFPQSLPFKVTVGVMFRYMVDQMRVERLGSFTSSGHEGLMRDMKDKLEYTVYGD